MKTKRNIRYLKHLEISKLPPIKISRRSHRHTCTPLRVHPNNIPLPSLRMRISLFLYPWAGGVGSRLACAHDSLNKATKHILMRKPPPQLQTCTSAVWILISFAQTVTPQARCTPPWHLMEAFSGGPRYRLQCQWGVFWQCQNRFWFFPIAFFFFLFTITNFQAFLEVLLKLISSLKLLIVANGCLL